jgi:anaerobic selenocysteine-containing dehydrogenase
VHQWSRRDGAASHKRICGNKQRPSPHLLTCGSSDLAGLGGAVQTRAMTATDDRPAPTVVRAACPHDCPDTCAMLVTVEDGRATGVRGDPDHPFTRGGLCVKVNNYQDKVYNPDHVLYPMRRTGPKGGVPADPLPGDDRGART